MKTKTIKILICENEQKPKLWPEPWKNRALEPEPHSWKPRAADLEQCSSSRRAPDSELWQFCSPEIIHTVAGHTDDPE